MARLHVKDFTVKGKLFLRVFEKCQNETLYMRARSVDGDVTL